MYIAAVQYANDRRAFPVVYKIADPTRIPRADEIRLYLSSDVSYYDLL